MADGLLCTHCGYQETLHGLVNLKFAMVDENEILTRFKMSLKQCMSTKGYTPEPYYTGELWNADPNCTHKVVPAPGGGVKCTKCPGWFCF